MAQKLFINTKTLYYFVLPKTIWKFYSCRFYHFWPASIFASVMEEHFDSLYFPMNFPLVEKKSYDCHQIFVDFIGIRILKYIQNLSYFSTSQKSKRRKCFVYTRKKEYKVMFHTFSCASYGAAAKQCFLFCTTKNWPIFSSYACNATAIWSTYST